ncbi:hypothetical protein AB0L50_36465 [Streptomyces flaveolus]|uniref:hypothetical protein n=1 Tax=Streptomyces flaveolus TaxID=67297 RepID=UPI00342148C8
MNALLSGLVGADRAEADPAAVAKVAERCAHLPLALRVAGNWLATRSGRSVQHLADRLAHEDRRLNVLAAGDVHVAAAFELSYHQLTPTAARLFRRLALMPGSDTSPAAAAQLVGQDVFDTEDTLELWRGQPRRTGGGDGLAGRSSNRRKRRSRGARSPGSVLTTWATPSMPLTASSRSVKNIDVLATTDLDVQLRQHGGGIHRHRRGDRKHVVESTARSCRERGYHVTTFTDATTPDTRREPPGRALDDEDRAVP